MAKLAATNVVFHEKLGTQGERVERIARLARKSRRAVVAAGFFSGKLLSADDLARSRRLPETVRRAAVLAKADLITEMVGEFPELQGLMGRYYATAQGEDAVGRRGDRGSLQAGRPVRPRAHRPGRDRRRARRQARHARRLLGDRREADREQGPVCAAARGAGGDPGGAGEWAAAARLMPTFRKARAWSADSTTQAEPDVAEYR